MKAHINGITVEGTPEEIAEYQRQVELKKTPDLCNWPKFVYGYDTTVKPWWMDQFMVISSHSINDHKLDQTSSK